jgi:hypothetical protein
LIDITLDLRILFAGDVLSQAVRLTRWIHLWQADMVEALERLA